jgi:hypothetical protein
VYYLEVYKINSLNYELVASVESKQPFLPFTVDAFINYSDSVRQKGEPLTGRLRIVEIEHTILRKGKGFIHKITLFAKHDRSTRF